MRDRERPPAPDYTNAALVFGFINLFWAFLLIWSLGGWAPVLLVAFLLNQVINWLGVQMADGPD